MDNTHQLDELIDGAEELLTKLADVHSPAVQALRDRVDHAITEARHTLSEKGDGVAVQLRDIAHTLDDYVRDYPWLALATGVAVAGTLGFILGATTAAKKGSPRWI